jgi:hypothetical protein
MSTAKAIFYEYFLIGECRTFKLSVYGLGWIFVHVGNHEGSTSLPLHFLHF